MVIRVECDGTQPAGKFRWIAQLGQVHVGRQERFLSNILGVGKVTRAVERCRVHGILIAPHDRVKGLEIPLENHLNKPGIAMRTFLQDGVPPTLFVKRASLL